MAQYDGSIRIGTGIDQKGFKAGSKEIESEARRMAQTVSKSLGDSAKIALQKQTDSFVKLNQQYANQEQRIKDLGSKLHDMQRQKIETAEFKELSKDLDKAKTSLDRLYERRDSYVELGKKTPPKLELDISDAERKVKILEADVKELIYTNKAYLPVDTSKIEQEIAAAEQKQMQMYTALQTAADSLTLKTSAEVAEEERLAAIRENAVVGNQHIVEVVERRKQLLQEIKDLESAGITEGYVDYDRRIEELEQLDQEIRDYSNSTDKMKESYKGLSGLMKRAFSIMAKGFKDIPIAVVKAGVKGLISLFRGLGNIVTKTIIQPFKLFGSVGKKALSSIIPLLKRATSSMFGFGKSTKNSNNTLKTGFKNILKYGLGIRSLYALINKLRTAIKEGFSNMAKEVEGFKSKVDGLKASALTLKNSFAAAFRPLVEAAIPYIQMVIDAMTNLLDVVGQFMAAITGQKTYTKAIKQTTAAIEDENKAQNKQLSGLDKLNNLSSGGGAEDSDSGGSKMFEEDVPISSPFIDMYQNLKEMVESEDWEGIGNYIATALNSGLQKIYDALNWETVGPQIAQFVTAFTGAFNGLVDGFNWDLLGQTIGAGINTAVNTLNLLITGIDWVNLGNGLANSINGLVNEVDFTNLGMLIGNKFMILPSIALGFVQNLDWSAIGAAIGNSLNGIVSSIDLSAIGTMLGIGLTGIFQAAIDFAATFDWMALGTNIYQGINSFFANTEWDKVGQGISDFALGLLDSLIIAIEGTNWQQIGESIKTFIANINWAGLAERLAEGVGAALGGLAALIWGLIKDAWNSVVEWWNEVAFEDGRFTILGLLEGIWEGIKNIGTWIYEHIFEPFINGFKAAFGIHSPSTVMSEMGVFLMEGLLGGIQSLMGSVLDVIKILWDGIKGVFEGFIQFFKGVFTGDWKMAWEGIKQIFSSIWNAIKGIVSTVINLIKSIISTAWNAIKTVTSSVWNGIKNAISTVINAVKTVISTGLNIIKGIWDKVWTGLKTTVVNIFNGIWNAIKGVINSILGGIENMANGVISGVNTIIGALNGLHFDIPDWVPALGGKTFGFNIPELSQVSIPRLATGTVVPPNREFMAVLGDNKREPEVVSPISTMKQADKEAILEVLSELGLTGGSRKNSGNETFVFQVDGKTFFEITRKYAEDYFMRTGRSPYPM